MTRARVALTGARRPNAPMLRALLVLLLAGCNVVHLHERAMMRRAATAGLVHAEHRLGRDSLAVWRGGHGRPLLLLHGFGASALWQWDHQLRELSRRHELVVPDLLGFGGSSGPDGDPSLDHQVRALIGLLDALDIEQADVVGVSYGGLVAYALAGAHPDRVRRLVMVDSPGHAWSIDDHRAMLGRFAAESAAALLVPDTPAGVRTLVGIASHRPPRLPDAVARRVVAELYDPHRADQRALLDHLERELERLAATLARPTQPTLAIWGAHDPVFPIEVGRRLAADLDAPLVVIPRARHLPNAEHPRRFVAELEAFLDETDREPGRAR